MDDILSNTERTLLALIKSSMFNVPFDPIQGIDWNDLYREAKAQTVTALIADRLPKDVGDNWKTAFIKNIRNNVRYLHEQSELVSIFRENNIPLVILKGTAAAVYYPFPLNRAMGDIDFIVPQYLYENACGLMLKQGYTLLNNNATNTRHKGYIKGKLCYELHHHFSYDDLDMEQYIIDGIQQFDYARIDGIEFPMLPKLANGLVLLAHLRRHLKVGLGLRQVIDWMMYVNKELNDSFWEMEFREAALKTGMEKLAVTVTKMCQMYLGLNESITWCQEADEHLCIYLMKDILSYGNFGRKHDEGLNVERMATTIKEVGVFRYLQISGENKFALYHRHRWLKPFCWIYQVFHLLMKILITKRCTKLFSDLEKSREKNDLLKQLEII